MSAHTAIGHRRSHGQVLLITLLILTVATTIALSLIGRATIDLSMSNQLEESTRAFNAAEAGIEQALKTGSGGTTVLTPGVTYDVTVSSIGGATGVFQVAHKTLQNATETLWLAQHDETGALVETPFYTSPTLEICWSQPPVSSPAAALGVSVVYKESTDGSYQVARAALDPDAATRNNNFDSTNITTTGCGLGYYGKQINFTSLGITPALDAILALRIRPYYADATIAIDGGASQIPKQGNQIESVGQTGTGVSRKVVVYQQYRTPLSIFDSVIYSQSNFGH
jgi:Tfp pilus assembly protein PilX